MGQALYRKHRPKFLKEVVGQEHITQTLEQALKQGKISHAYLFTGPRGVGKTSVARIMAHEINGLPYTDDSAHMDIIEIDAASNRRIDEIRELRDKVYVAPTSAKYKVYIIDEVHMLTREAFNALLKTLEEPPEHAVFILATTDAHKLPDTIVSRTQRFGFKPVDNNKVIEHLQDIAKTEGINVSKDALQLLAAHGEGSFRDSISLLDQASSSGKKLELSDVQALLGIPPSESLESLLEAVAGGGSSATIMKNLSGLFDQGFQASAIAKQLSKILREQITEGARTELALPQDQAFELLHQLIEVPVAHDPERFLEIALLRAHLGVTPQAVKATAEPVAEQPKASPAKAEPKPEANEISEEPAAKPTPKAVKVTPTAVEVADDTVWPTVLQTLKQRHNTLYGVVRMAQPTFNDDGLKLTFQFAFHQKRLNESANRKLLAAIIEELTGKTIAIECVFDKTVTVPATTLVVVPEAEPADISAISNIFGGGELLES